MKPPRIPTFKELERTHPETRATHAHGDLRIRVHSQRQHGRYPLLDHVITVAKEGAASPLLMIRTSNPKRRQGQVMTEAVLSPDAGMEVEHQSFDGERRVLKPGGLYSASGSEFPDRFYTGNSVVQVSENDGKMSFRSRFEGQERDPKTNAVNEFSELHRVWTLKPTK